MQGRRFAAKGTLTDQWWSYVLRLDHARLPKTSTTKGGGCVLAQSGWFRPAFHALMAWDTCSIFAVPVWTSTFSNVYASDVPLSSTVLPSRESFPIHFWFVSRCNTGCDRLVAVTRSPTFERALDGCRGRAPLWRAVDCLGARPESCQILRVERPQGRCNSSPNPYNSFFHSWAEQRDPKLSANKQSRPAHR